MTTSDLFEAALASLEMLDGVKRAPSDEFSGADYALRLARRTGGRFGAHRALRMVPPGHKGLDVKLLKRLLASHSPALRLEAARTLAETAFPETPSLLRALAADEKAESPLRLTAIAGLAAVLQRDEHDSATLGLLRRLLAGSDRDFQAAALRALRRSLRNPDVRTAVMELTHARAAAQGLRGLTDQIPIAFRMSGLAVPEEVDTLAQPRPLTAENWIRLGASGGSADAGRRILRPSECGGLFSVSYD